MVRRPAVLVRLTAPAAGALAAGLVGLGALPAAASTAPAAPTSSTDGPAAGEPLAGERIVIAHRGASGYRPEHTLAAYELGARLGADYFEPDLVSTADGVLVARHEPEISTTTDVASRPEFADRRATKTIDGVEYTGWFTEDFTLAELKTLRAVERLPALRQESTTFDGRFEVPTFAEVLELRDRLSEELGREIGVYPETKHPTYFDGLGLSLEEPLVEALEEAGLDEEDSPVFVQSFETANLRELDEAGLEVPLVQLLDEPDLAPADLAAAGDPRTYADLLTPEGLAGIAEYADGVGPYKLQVVPLAPDGTLGEPTSLVADAHAAGLLVHPYTFRPENEFLPSDLDSSTTAPQDYGDSLGELAAYWATGIDGLFTDTPDIGVLSRALLADPDAQTSDVGTGDVGSGDGQASGEASR